MIIDGVRADDGRVVMFRVRVSMRLAWDEVEVGFIEAIPISETQVGLT